MVKLILNHKHQRHPRESGDRVAMEHNVYPIPAFAGMTLMGRFAVRVAE